MWNKAHRELTTMSKRYAVRHMMRTSGTLRKLPKNLQDKVDTVLIRFVKVIPPAISIEKKVALIYHVLTSQITYDKKGMHESKIPYTFIGALCGRKAVCMGIAELFTYLCTLIGIKAITVIGYYAASAEDNNAGLHAWNMVKLSDGRYYHLDATGDLHKPDPDWEPRWFLKSDEEMYGHYWIPEDYPKARKDYYGNIEINQKGVDLLCQHWTRLTAQLGK